MTKKNICELVTKKVVEYINNGYVITPDSFSGSDGTSRVDLVKGDSFIRIFIDNTRDEGTTISLHFKYAKRYSINMKHEESMIQILFGLRTWKLSKEKTSTFSTNTVIGAANTT